MRALRVGIRTPKTTGTFLSTDTPHRRQPALRQHLVQSVRLRQILRSRRECVAHALQQIHALLAQLHRLLTPHLTHRFVQQLHDMEEDQDVHRIQKPPLMTFRYACHMSVQSCSMRPHQTASCCSRKAASVSPSRCRPT